MYFRDKDIAVDCLRIETNNMQHGDLVSFKRFDMSDEQFDAEVAMRAESKKAREPR